MTHDFLLLHLEGPERFAIPEGLEHFAFATCMRHILIVDADDSQAAEVTSQATHVLRSDDAYKLLLEVICGLRSPLIGETEVSGQFKNTVAAYTPPTTPWGATLVRLFKSLFEDAKRIRQTHLGDLGSQSYGSILRRELRSRRRVHVLGAGHIVREILPWIAKDGSTITIHCRNPLKAIAELGPSLASRVSIVTLDAPGALQGAEALVVAAPVSAEWVSEWVGQLAGSDTKLQFVADLRSDSGVDRLAGFDIGTKILDLSRMISTLNDNQAVLHERKRLALEAVELAATVRARHVDYRPFGWDDVCA